MNAKFEKKSIDLSWVKDYLQKNKKEDRQYEDDGPKIWWSSVRSKVAGQYVTSQYNFRLVPNSEKDIQRGERFGLMVYRHWGMPTNGGKDTRFLCPEYTYPSSDVKCPICEAIREMERAGIDPEALDDYRPSDEFYMRGVMLDTPNPGDADSVGKAGVIQMNGLGSKNALIAEYAREDRPDYLDTSDGEVVSFMFDKSQGNFGMWKRELNAYHPMSKKPLNSEVIEVFKDLNLTDVFPVPTDNRVNSMIDSANLLKSKILPAGAAIKEAVSVVKESVVGDDRIPEEFKAQPRYDGEGNRLDNNGKKENTPTIEDDNIGEVFGPRKEETPKQVEGECILGDKTKYSLSEQACMGCPMGFNCYKASVNK